MAMTAVFTLVIAAGAGHIMQYGMSGETSQAMPAPRPSQWKPMQTRADASVLFFPSQTAVSSAPTVSTIALIFPEPEALATRPSSLPRTRLSRISVPADSFIAPPGDNEINLNDFGMACEQNLSASAAPGAMIALQLDAPCELNAVVDIQHAGLNFRMRTDKTGQLAVSIPAMTSEASVSVIVGNNIALSREVSVPDAADYDRVAMQWNGSSALSLHALEFDAGPGDAGHISARRSGLPTSGDRAAGGFLQRFGEPELENARMAEIYSFPSGYIDRDGTVRLSVAVRVTDANCGETLPVSRIQTRAGEPIEVTQIQISLPGCDSAGTILVLKNLLEDLKIAGK
jgi:hypothetical protein